jgi:hypothetical protein
MRLCCGEDEKTMKTEKTPLSSNRSNERGSLALEHVLFIGAIVTMSAGLFAFYDNIADYLRTFNFSSLPTGVPSSSGGGTPSE